MKGFQKLALASAIAALPLSGMAMEPLNDTEMSGVTGQDGISLNLDIDITTDVWYEDTTGHAAFTHGGFITLEQLNIVAPDLIVDIDVASADLGAGEHTGAGSGALVISIDAVDPITITNLEIGVQGSDTAEGVAEVADETRLGDIVNSDTIISIAELTVSPDDMVVALGPQRGDGNLVAGNDLAALTGNTGQITLDNVEIRGGTTPNAGFIGVEQIVVNDVVLGDAADPTTVNLVAGGLEMQTSTLMDGIDVTLSRVSIGDDTTAANTLGNIYLRNLDLGGQTITVSGKE